MKRELLLSVLFLSAGAILADWTQGSKLMHPMGPATAGSSPSPTTNGSPGSWAATLASKATTPPKQGQWDEEFAGPFSNWLNVKTSFGAAGDGVTDDTGALQNALNALSGLTPVIYLPAGTYRITQTLNLVHKMQINIIGEDPSNTSIVWAGASGGTMLNLNGVGYSRIDRITFNGQGSAGVDVDQSWDNGGAFFDTANQYADDVFENAGTGFRCGNLRYGCAETSMLRDKFLNNTVAGVAMKNFNALDMFIWYSLFINNAEGVTNYPGAGNFHVFNSVFQGSTTADLTIDHTGVFNFRNNYSIGSKQFMGPSVGTGNPANVTLEGNIILDTKSAASIAAGHMGPLVMIDNTIRSLASVTSGPVAKVSGFMPGDLFSTGNIFTAISPLSSTGRLHTAGDQVVARSSINPTMPVLPGTPPNNHRQIFEVAAGSTAAQIQQAIYRAASAGSGKPIVHLQAGGYNIGTTLVVPAGSGMQITGDGFDTVLYWTGTTSGPILKFAGPSKATLREIEIRGNNTANGIEVTNADQPGSHIFMQQAILIGSQVNLFSDALDYTNVELHDLEHEASSSTALASVNVTGGPLAERGLPAGGATNIFAGVSFGNHLSYGASNGAHLSVRDIWYDSSSGGTTIANISGNSTFTYAGASVNLSGKAINFTNFTGTAGLINLFLNGGNITVSGDCTNGKVLGLGLVGPTPIFINSSSPAAASELLTPQTTTNPAPMTASTAYAEQGTPDPAFLTATLEQVRTQQPAFPGPLPPGVTDLRFYRVLVRSALTGIHLNNAH